MEPPTELLTVPDVAEVLGTDVVRVRNLISDGSLLARRGDDGVLRIPALFVRDGVVVKGLPGVITLLRDGGFSDDEAYDWLLADDPSLPGCPAQALAEDRGREVKRRAQSLAV